MRVRTVPSLLVLSVAIAAAGMTTAIPASAATIFTVNSLGDIGDADTGDGVCDVDLATSGLQCTLRAAIHQANVTVGADSIEFGVAGTVTVSSPELFVTDDLTIVGSSSGTTLDADLASRIMSTSSDVDLTLQAMTLTEGSTAQHGGALYHVGTSLSLTDVSFIQNGASMQGGALYNLSGSLTVVRGAFLGNGGAEGGAVSSDSTTSPMSFSGVIFANNTATNRGGAVALASAATFKRDVSSSTSTTFNGNSATNDGGAVFSYGSGRPVFDGVLFTLNQSSNGRGGAIALNPTEPDAPAVLKNGTALTMNSAGAGGGGLSVQGPWVVSMLGRVVFSGNSTNSYGGAMRNNGGVITALDVPGTTRNEIVNNTAALDGGGIYNEFGDLDLDDTLMDQNDAGWSGGAIDLYNGHLQLSDSVLTGNTSQIMGGAIRQYTATSEIGNTTISGNTATKWGGGLFVGGATSLTNVNVSNNAAGTPGGSGVNAYPGSGGGIFAAAPLTMTGGIVSNNDAHDDAEPSTSTSPQGGGIYLDSSAPSQLHGVTMQGNDTDGQGGAIWAVAPLTIDRLGTTSSPSFVSNTSTLDGGAIFQEEGDLTIADATFIDNSTLQYGGAIDQEEGGDLSIARSRFQSNSATISGGALSFRGGTAAITDSTFHDNHSAGEAGAIGNDNSGVEAGLFSIARSTFSANDAVDAGGAIKHNGHSLSLDNVTISGNDSGETGGGIYASGGPVTIANSTIVGNDAKGDGGLLGGGGVHGSSVTVANTVLHGNRTEESPGVYVLDNCTSFIGSEGFNFDSDGTCIEAGNENVGDAVGATGAPLNPKLSALGPHGGPMETHLPLAGSPLIDTGLAMVEGDTTDPCTGTDQRGIARPQDGDGNTTKVCDKGAVELPNVPPKLTIKGVRLKEGNRGTRGARFKLTLSYAFDKTVSIKLRTVKGTAKSPRDFKAKSSTVSFAPGQRAKTFVVAVKGDRKRERKETFFVKLSSPVNARPVLFKVRGIIVNDD